MKNAQYFVDSLRQGNYYEFLQYLKFINNKYSMILSDGNGPKSLGMDEILPLATYELCMTDFSEKDLKKLHFFSEYLQDSELNRGEIGFSLVNLATICPQVLLMKNESKFQEKIKSVKIENIEDFELFNQNNSIFSQLVRNTQAKENCFAELINKSFTKQDLEQYTQYMDPEETGNFTRSIRSINNDIAKENDRHAIEIQAAERNRLIITIIREYKDFLSTKIAEKNINRGDSNLSAIEQKLVNREQALQDFLNSNQDFANNKDLISNARTAFTVCLANQPDWSERPFLQKLTDALSLFIKPAYRTFFSQESKYMSRLADEVMTQNPRIGGG